MSNQTRQEVTKPTLLLIGLSGGLTAACFPRFMPFLSGSANVSIDLFTQQYLWMAGGFSLIIGIAMIWLYNGTREHTKNLFLSSLALPAILSGGINVASISSNAGQAIDQLNTQTNRLLEQLQRDSGIETMELEIDHNNNIDLGFLLPLIGLSNAHAGVDSNQNPSRHGLRIRAANLERNYVLSFGSADNAQQLNVLRQRLLQYQIEGLTSLRIGDNYYLLSRQRTTKTQALIDAVEIQRTKGITPQVVKLK